MTGPPSRGRLFLRDLLLILGLPLVLFIALLSYWKPWEPRTYRSASVRAELEMVSGTWDWRRADSMCVANPHTISFSPDQKVMVITHRRSWTDSTGKPHRVAIYDIQELDETHIRGLIRGEDRQTEEGKPVVWDLLLTSPNSYTWHRTDWRSGGRTAEVKRCPPGTDSLIPPADTGKTADHQAEGSR